MNTNKITNIKMDIISLDMTYNPIMNKKIVNIEEIVITNK